MLLGKGSPGRPDAAVSPFGVLLARHAGRVV